MGDVTAFLGLFKYIFLILLPIGIIGGVFTALRDKRSFAKKILLNVIIDGFIAFFFTTEFVLVYTSLPIL